MMKLVAVIAALEEELLRIRGAMSSVTLTRLAGIDFHQGRIGDLPVVACKSGVGKVNASMCAQALIDRFAPNAIIFTGVAGALDPTLDIGDAVISLDCQQHDIDVTSLGFPRGTLPEQETSVYPADSSLVTVARMACGDILGREAFTGRILSGDQFVANLELAQNLHRDMGGACIEMEGAAVAQVCHANDTPFVVIRTISDRADGAAPHNFPAFLQEASDRSAQIVRSMLSLIASA